MSRRAPNLAADRAAQNAQTIKTLLKLETNKSCADCKRNKHPRWASWNLGVFVCIRCSGIHRGMGTHISRVKSVDLDAWTDEQMQSVLRWGNARANKYWEAKLAVGHVPSEAKIENFIRTKYESKRWVMDGPIPDPATLDADGDDDMPLNVVLEKTKLDRSSSQRASSTSSQPVPPPRATVNADLFGGVAPVIPARPSTTDTPGSRPPPIEASTPFKPTRLGDSLLGLDFFAGPPSAPISRSVSGASNTTSNGPSRPDLKQSILSLYASAPRPQSQPQHTSQPSFGGTQAPQPSQQSNFGGLDDKFSGLSFASATSPPAPQPQAQSKSNSFAIFGNLASQRSTVAAAQVTAPALVSPLPSGGSFFDLSPKPLPKPVATTKPMLQTPQPQRLSSGFGDGFGDFASASSTISSVKPAPGPSSDNNQENLEPIPAPVNSKPPASSLDLTSAFNLSAPAPKPVASESLPTVQTTPASLSNLSTADAWGSNDAWANPDPSPVASKTASSKYPALTLPSENNLGSWGGASMATPGLNSGNSGFGAPVAPKVTADEDFGGWNSAAPVSPPRKMTSGSKPGGGFGGSDDLFSNVWE